ncbi:MAG TPA: DUF1456 family protein [Flavobacterium sp.]|jgi:uncharacterized protein YehS (DUF1456 family)|nr:DUF1456 family protein [Flavobacterium sp.]
MTNNDIFKKLRVALQLRDDQIVEIMQLVDFRITKSELGAIFRAEDHENYMECGDQILRNFLNGLVIHLRGTKENPKNPREVLAKNESVIAKKATVAKKEYSDKKNYSDKKPFAKKAPTKGKINPINKDFKATLAKPKKKDTE